MKIPNVAKGPAAWGLGGAVAGLAGAWLLAQQLEKSEGTIMPAPVNPIDKKRYSDADMMDMGDENEIGDNVSDYTGGGDNSEFSGQQLLHDADDDSGDDGGGGYQPATLTRVTRGGIGGTTPVGVAGPFGSPYSPMVPGIGGIPSSGGVPFPPSFGFPPVAGPVPYPIPYGPPIGGPPVPYPVPVGGGGPYPYPVPYPRRFPGPFPHRRFPFPGVHPRCVRHCQHHKGKKRHKCHLDCHRQHHWPFPWRGRFSHERFPEHGRGRFPRRRRGPRFLGPPIHPGGHGGHPWDGRESHAAETLGDEMFGLDVLGDDSGIIDYGDNEFANISQAYATDTDFDDEDDIDSDDADDGYYEGEGDGQGDDFDSAPDFADDYSDYPSDLTAQVDPELDDDPDDMMDEEQFADFGFGGVEGDEQDDIDEDVGRVDFEEKHGKHHAKHRGHTDQGRHLGHNKKHRKHEEHNKHKKKKVHGKHKGHKHKHSHLAEITTSHFAGLDPGQMRITSA